MEADTETIHTIKEVHYREQSDIAIVELHYSVNNCSDSETNAGKCWKITPVKLPSNNLEIRENQTVYALGKNNPMIMKVFHCKFQGWGLYGLGLGFVAPSENLRQVELTIHSTGTEKPGLIETKVGPNGEDACAGDSGEDSISKISRICFTKLFL